MANQLVETEMPSLWSRYWKPINFKSDLKSIFFRSHTRHATLDGARAITILLLVLFHVLYGVILLLKGNTANLEAFFVAFPDHLNWMWQTQGSDPLFVISGLLVSFTIFRELKRTGSLDIWRFYKRRLMRIYPLFILALLLYLPSREHNWDYLLSNLFFVSNYIPGHKTIIPVGWSLEVQMQFYLLLPVLCLLVLAIRWRIALLAGLSIAAVIYRYWVVASNPEFYETPLYQVIYDNHFANLMADNLWYDLDVRIGGFFMGVLVAYLHCYYGKTITAYFKRHLFINATILAIAVYMIFWSFGFPLLNKGADFYNHFDAIENLWYLAFNRYVYSLGMSIIVLLVLCPAGLSRIVNWVFCWPVWHPFGELIYSIYLFHFPFIALGALITFGTTNRDSVTSVSVLQILSIYCWSVAFTVIFSALVHIYIEKPFLRMRESR